MTKKAAKSAKASEKETKSKDLTISRSMSDFRRAYSAKRKLIEREHEDFLFALGEQWSAEDKEALKRAGFAKPFTDNRIGPNLFLLTGLERQNRSDFKAYPIGEEDGVKAEIASALFEDAIRKSGYRHKSSEQFKDGITCGESHLEIFLDYTESVINGAPKWRKCDGNTIFPDPASREYDFSDARFVYKITTDIAKGDLINLYPEMQDEIEASSGGRLDLQAITSAGGAHIQPKDYPREQQSGQSSTEVDQSESFDLVERYYKKFVERTFIGDKQTGEITEADTKEKAREFVDTYKASIAQDQQSYEEAVSRAVMQHREAHAAAQTEATQALAAVGAPAAPPPDMDTASVVADLQNRQMLPPPPPQRDPERFIVFTRQVPEIWCFAHTPALEEPLCDERAWFYPKWKGYPFVPYFARHSTAPVKGDDNKHLLIQGIVHGVKGAQERHNRAEMLTQRHLNSSANSGWLSEEDVWVDPAKVREFGTVPGVNLEFKRGRPQPQRIQPAALSEAHAQIAMESAESIKAQLGINSDLIATQQSGGDSGRAIALRQKQGLLMVQELFDNLSRSREIAGQILLSQLGECYDTEAAMKVLGDAFLKDNFPPPMLQNPDDPTAPPQPMLDPKTGQPMDFDKDMATVAIAEVLGGQLGDYAVSIGEVVASETQRMQNAAELNDMAKTYPGIVPPQVLVKHSQLPETTKQEIMQAIESQQQAAAQADQEKAAHAAAAARFAEHGAAGPSRTPRKGGR